MVKGIGRVDEARRAIDAGATTISVSNHGGNNIDGSPAPIRVLREIAEAVGADVEIVLDGGIRRGSDVVKALAFGAKAGHDRPRLSVGPRGQRPGRCRDVLDVLRMGIDSTLMGIGKANIADLTPDDIVTPDDFSPKPLSVCV